MRKTSLVGFCMGAALLLAFQPGVVSELWSGEKDGGDIIYKDTKKFAPVLFSHAKHKEAGNKCQDCHPGIFKKKAGSADVDNAMRMKTMKKGEFCGACHDGVAAFNVKGSCKTCHPKK